MGVVVLLAEEELPVACRANAEPPAERESSAVAARPDVSPSEEAELKSGKEADLESRPLDKPRKILCKPRAERSSPRRSSPQEKPLTRETVFPSGPKLSCKQERT